MWTRLGCGVFLGLSALLLGCERFQLVSDCNRLAQVVNPAVAEIAGVRKEQPKSTDPAVYDKLSARYESLAKVLMATSFADKRTADDAKVYAQSFSQAASLSKEFARALPRGDSAALERLSGALKLTTAMEGRQVAKLKARCVAH